MRNVLCDMTQVGSDMALHSASCMCEVLISLDPALLFALGVASFRVAVFVWKRHRGGKAMMMVMMMMMVVMMMMMVVVCAWAMLCSASLQSWCIEYFVDLGIVGPQFLNEDRFKKPRPTKEVMTATPVLHGLGHHGP